MSQERGARSYGQRPVYALAILLAVLGLLPGCGFHLRGSADVAPRFSSLYIQGGNPYGPLVTELRRELRSVGTRVTEEAALAQAVLVIQREDYNRSVLAVGSTAKAREYGLRLQVEFQVNDPKGQVLLPAQSVLAVRDYSFDPTAVLGSADQEVILRDDMVRDAVQQILLRLRAHPGGK